MLDLWGVRCLWFRCSHWFAWLMIVLGLLGGLILVVVFVCSVHVSLFLVG